MPQILQDVDKLRITSKESTAMDPSGEEAEEGSLLFGSNAHIQFHTFISLHRFLLHAITVVSYTAELFSIYETQSKDGVDIR